MSHVISGLMIVYFLKSSGKSSVLESIVGKDFLPRGSGDFQGPNHVLSTFLLILIYLSFTLGYIILQELLLAGPSYCNFIKLMKGESMQSLCTFPRRSSPTLVIMCRKS